MESNTSLNKRSVIEKTVHDVFHSLESNNFSILGRENEPMWERPLIGIAAGDDSYYDFLKEHIGPFHWTPAEAFARKYGSAPEASKLSVLSIAFPQTEQTKDMQRQSRDVPCDNWLMARREWESVVRVFCEKLEEAFEQMGIRSACPDLLSGMTRMESETVGLASTWSQRHTAYAAGLGTFGLNDGLITTEGLAMRFTSIILEADLPANGKVSEDPYAWCNKCGACIRRCPGGAITLDGGHDKQACSTYKDNYVISRMPEYIERGDFDYGCGLCQAGVPCMDHPPKQGELQYRKIQRSDDPFLAQLVRMNLQDNGLDIPGTAYWDGQLDELYEFYSSQPDRRSYFVIVNEQGRAVGGAGLDAFEALDRCAELQKLYVANDYKRHGIGRHLIALVEEEARRLGYETMYLETHSNLKAAQRLYEKEGYESIPRQEFSMHDTMDLFLIKKL